MNYKNILLGMLNNLINGTRLTVSAYSAAELQELIKAIEAAERNPAEIQSLSRQMMIEQDILLVYLNDIKQQALAAIKQGRIQGSPLVPKTIPIPQAPKSTAQTQADLLPLAERKRLFAAGGAKPAASANPLQPARPPSSVARKFFGDASPAAISAESRKFEFSNQSNQMAAAWIPKYQNGWLPVTLAPERDSGQVTPLEGQTIYIYTTTGFFVMRVQNGVLSLNKESPLGPGNVRMETIKTMPYAEALDLIVIINPNGSIDFVKRRP